MEKDRALDTVEINCNPDSKYSDRKWQGIPGIERTGNGRLFVTFYSGGDGEGPHNYSLLIKSDDDGHTWSEPLFAVDPPCEVRAFDPCLWCDPLGRLWWFWSQSYGWFDGRVGVWASICEDPDNNRIEWSQPKRIANGVMMNKPTVISTGEWLFPCAVWDCETSELNHLSEERFSNVYRTNDNGETFGLLGGADVPKRSFDEHMIVERKDGSLWMLARTSYGIGQSVSYDRGRTWSPGKETELGGPNSRFFIRRLNSGNLLFVNHYNYTGRNNLTASISDDDGLTWKGFLLLDESDNVSYPDGVQSDDDIIYIVYDRDRFGKKEILMSVFNEEDVLAGNCVSEKSRLKIVVNKG